MKMLNFLLVRSIGSDLQRGGETVGAKVPVEARINVKEMKERQAQYGDQGALRCPQKTDRGRRKHHRGSVVSGGQHSNNRLVRQRGQYRSPP